jgi:uncharacterized protein (TIGR03435 family)
MLLRLISTVGLIFLRSAALVGQSAPPVPTFEIASVKPSNPDARGSTYGFAPRGGLNVINGTLKGIIEMAYDVRDFQVSGGPGWIDSDRYDISTKNALDDPLMRITDRQERNKEARRRLQTLLAERFQLKVHRETKDLSEYALSVERRGLKIKEVADAPATGIRSRCGQLNGTKTTMTNLALTLAGELGRPVVDRTGLSGKYDFQLVWTPETRPCAQQPTDIGSPEAVASPSDGPSIFTALQEQLGLKLDAVKGPVEIIVVDHAEKASAN